MNNTKNKPYKQEQINQLHDQQQKTRREPVPKREGRDSADLYGHLEHHEQELPETRMTR
jgi:hypothetical protein